MADDVLLDTNVVDAYLAAFAQEAKTAALATFNKRDFRRFPWLKLIP